MENALQAPIVVTFDKFSKGDFDKGKHNLYIIWCGKQALYVGISRADVWSRWFARSGNSHMYKVTPRDNTGKQIRPSSWQGVSPIGRAIAKNLPASLCWKVELRHIEKSLLDEVESDLIHDLHPLFNSTYQPTLTTEELKLYEYLTRDQLDLDTTISDFIPL